MYGPLDHCSSGPKILECVYYSMYSGDDGKLADYRMMLQVPADQAPYLCLGFDVPAHSTDQGLQDPR